MRLRGFSRSIKGTALLLMMSGAAAGLSGCAGEGNGGSVYAPSSLVGKTMKSDESFVSVIFTTESEAKLKFSNRVVTCAESSPTTYSYSVEGADGPRLKLSYSFTQKSMYPRIHNETSGSVDLVLDFVSSDNGTANGSHSYTFVDYKSDERTSADNVPIISAPFGLMGS